MPEVSVVIPTARGGSYLRTAVESVLAQSFPDWELVVVDDGSGDDLRDLDTIDRRVRIIRQDRRGVSVARNVGIAASSGEFLALLDDDDRMLANRLERQVQALRSAPECGMAHSQVDIIDGLGRVTGGGSLHDVQYSAMLAGDFEIVTPSVTLRRSTLDQVGRFDPLLRAGEDIDLFLRMARCSMILFQDEVLTQYRRHGSNQYTEPRRFQRDLQTIFERHLSVATRDGDLASAQAARRGMRTFRRYNASQAIDLAHAAGLSDNGRRAAGFLASALVLAPEVVIRRCIAFATHLLTTIQ